MHYRGQLRVKLRDGGIRVYAAHEHSTERAAAAFRRIRVDPLVDVTVGTYARLPRASLEMIVARLRYAVPQWRNDHSAPPSPPIKRHATARIDGIDRFFQAA